MKYWFCFFIVLVSVPLYLLIYICSVFYFMGKHANEVAQEHLEDLGVDLP